MLSLKSTLAFVVIAAPFLALLVQGESIGLGDTCDNYNRICNNNRKCDVPQKGGNCVCLDVKQVGEQCNNENTYCKDSRCHIKPGQYTGVCSSGRQHGSSDYPRSDNSSPESYTPSTESYTPPESHPSGQHYRRSPDYTRSDTRREPHTESREPHTEHREPHTEHREPHTEHREPHTESREHHTEPREHHPYGQPHRRSPGYTPPESYNLRDSHFEGQRHRRSPDYTPSYTPSPESYTPSPDSYTPSPESHTPHHKSYPSGQSVSVGLADTCDDYTRKCNAPYKCRKSHSDDSKICMEEKKPNEGCNKQFDYCTHGSKCIVPDGQWQGTCSSGYSGPTTQSHY